MLFFEKLFFVLDPDGSGEQTHACRRQGSPFRRPPHAPLLRPSPSLAGTLTLDEAGRLLAFTTPDKTPEQRAAALRAADEAGDLNGELDRGEFVDLCLTNMRNVPLSQARGCT